MKAGLHRQPCCKRTVLICEKAGFGQQTSFCICNWANNWPSKQGWRILDVFSGLQAPGSHLFVLERVPLPAGNRVCSLVTAEPRGSTKNGDCAYKTTTESCSPPYEHCRFAPQMDQKHLTLLLGILFCLDMTRLTQLLSLLL